MFKNAGYCALNIANNSGEDEEEDLDEEMEEEVVAVDAGGVDPNINYYELAISYFEQYLAVKPDDVKLVQAIASTFLYQLGNCERGVEYFEKLLTLEPNNCEANKSLGYAYFGELCTQNFSRALTYLTQALDCNVKAGKTRGDDPSLLLWIAQTYHFRAVERQEAKQPKEQYQKDYEDYQYGKQAPSSTKESHELVKHI